MSDTERHPQVPPEHPVSEVVPSDVRARRLPEEVRAFVDRAALFLAEAYHFDYNVEDEQADYENAKHRQLTDTEWQWYGRGSERTVACLGRTFRGEPIYDDLRGVVVKFNPWLRLGDIAEQDERAVSFVVESGNLHELAVWTYAGEHGHTAYFAPILDYGQHGDWLAMQWMLPVYVTGHPTFANHDLDYISDKRSGWGLTSALNTVLTDRGYDPHIKDGNVGFDLRRAHPRLIDYGAHIDIEEHDRDTLTAFVRER